MCALAVSFAISNAAAAQDAPLGARTDSGCSPSHQNKVFEIGAIRGADRFQNITVPRIVTRFMTKPDSSAGVEQIRRHVAYAKVLGSYVAKKSSRQCFFAHTLGASLDLVFEISRIGEGDRDECFVQRCAQQLSDLIESADIDKQSFANAIDALVQNYRASDSVGLTTPVLSTLYAALEAFRHIYPAGARERILVDVSAEDYLSVGFDEFRVWLREQQSAMRDMKDGKARPIDSRRAEARPAQSQTCSASADAHVEELNIDHHGWGHRSIVMINYAVDQNEDHRINDPTLRAFCPPGEGRTAALDEQPWREMAGRVSCTFTGFDERSRWLVLSSREAPAHTRADMSRYAQAIARMLNADRCVHPELRVFVANFLRQR
jgi:hypothetical protein